MLTVILTDHLAAELYPRFLKALSCLTNLETLQIVDQPEDQAVIRKSLFEHKYKFHSVRTLVVSGHSLYFIEACPNCRSLYVRQLQRPSFGVTMTPNALAEHVGEWCPDLEELQYYPPASIIITCLTTTGVC